jgi:hypothetical protein
MLPTVTASDANLHGRIPKSLSLEVERLSWRIERQNEHLTDLGAMVHRSDPRVVLREQLSRSEAELVSTSARFNEVAATIPDDIGHLADRLSAILNAAAVEAKEIRAEAHRFAETVRVEAEEHAARTGAEARADIARLREQAIFDATKILAEAETQAEEMLASVQRDIDAQVVAARVNLDELGQVRAKIVAQLEGFYHKFNAMECSGREVDPVRTISLAPFPSDLRSAYGAHSAHNVEVSRGPLGDVE